MNAECSLTKMSNLFLACVIFLFLGCKRDSQSCNVKTATLDDVEKATFTICNYGKCGSGVFVGYFDGGDERIFFLTARHVVTFRDISESRLDISLGSRKDWPVHTARSRWFTAHKRYDAAWFELNERERHELIDRGSLCYISLDRSLDSRMGAQIQGTCAIPLQEYAVQHKGELPEVWMFYRANIMDGKLDLARMDAFPLPFGENKVFKFCEITCVPVIDCEKLCTPGDSGCAAFMRTHVDGLECWALAGLVIGGNTNYHINVVQPLDVVADEIRHPTIKLGDHPELW